MALIDLTIPDKAQLLCGICLGVVCTQMYTLYTTYIHEYIHAFMSPAKVRVNNHKVAYFTSIIAILKHI